MEAVSFTSMALRLEHILAAVGKELKLPNYLGQVQIQETDGLYILRLVNISSEAFPWAKEPLVLAFYKGLDCVDYALGGIDGAVRLDPRHIVQAQERGAIAGVFCSATDITRAHFVLSDGRNLVVTAPDHPEIQSLVPYATPTEAHWKCWAEAATTGEVTLHLCVEQNATLKELEVGIDTVLSGTVQEEEVLQKQDAINLGLATLWRSFTQRVS